jgi:hypothetical protein
MWVGGGSRYEEPALLTTVMPTDYHGVYLSHSRLNYGLNHIKTAYTDGVMISLLSHNTKAHYGVYGFGWRLLCSSASFGG